MVKKVILILLSLIIVVLLGVGCDNIKTLRVEQPTPSSVVIISNAGGSWSDDYDLAYQILYQLDKKVRIENYTFSQAGSTLRTTVILASPAVVTLRKFTDNDNSTQVEVIVGLVDDR